MSIEIDETEPLPVGSGAHAWVVIGDCAFFANDSMDDMAPPSRSTLWIYTDNVDAALKRAVDAGAMVRMPLADMFWGEAKMKS